MTGRAVHLGDLLPAWRHPNSKPLPRPVATRCATPGCGTRLNRVSRTLSLTGLFCRPCARRLARVRGELEGEKRSYRIWGTNPEEHE